jgi:anti-sigma B factor antagonist
MNELGMREEDRAGILVVSVEGFLDAHTASKFEQMLAQAIAQKRYRIVVQCAGLTYISSTGLGVFMAFIDTVRDAGGDIKLACVTPKVYKVFDLLGFPKLLEFYGTVDEALPRFASSASR